MKYFSIILLLAGFFSACQPTPKNEKSMSDNPLLSKWETPFGVPPYDQIKSDDYLSAIKEAVKMHEKEIAAIIANTEVPTFENTIVAMEHSGADLTKVRKVFYAVNAAHTNDTLKATAKEIAPLLAKHRDNILLNPELFERVKKVYEDRDKLDLNKEEAKLLEETYKNFNRSGANLDEKEQDRLREINQKLASLSQQFGDNVLDDTNSFELHVTDEKDLGNLASGYVANAAAEAKKRGHDTGWSFTTQRPSINPFLASSPNKELRKKMIDAYTQRGDNNNEFDNKKLISEMVALRLEKANLLGYDNYAAYVLSEAMAKTPEAVMSFLDQVWEPALAMAKKEREALAAKMKSETGEDNFGEEDWRYYVEKVRAERYNFDENETKPYFELSAVIQGAFTLANKLFGITFTENKDLPRWHPTQDVFEVREADGKHIGVLYMDYYARESKKGGAWMNSLRSQSRNGDEFITPVITNNFNFPAPSEGMPTLLTFREAQTVFHEFGHGLHGLLSNVTYESLSGTNVPRDFVEFPSQVMENWTSEPEFLKLYAKHYETGEVIPMEMIQKMNDANQFNQGFATVEYMAAAYLDMAWHMMEEGNIEDVDAFERQALDEIALIDEIESRYRSTYFNHIFSGGYAAGYYSYLWSEILDADTFAAFKESGDLFNKELAAKYRTVISKGGSQDGMELYKEFRGKEPDIQPLLARKGF